MKTLLQALFILSLFSSSTQPKEYGTSEKTVFKLTPNNGMHADASSDNSEQYSALVTILKNIVEFTPAGDSISPDGYYRMLYTKAGDACPIQIKIILAPNEEVTIELNVVTYNVDCHFDVLFNNEMVVISNDLKPLHFKGSPTGINILNIYPFYKDDFTTFLLNGITISQGN